MFVCLPRSRCLQPKTVPGAVLKRAVKQLTVHGGGGEKLRGESEEEEMRMSNRHQFLQQPSLRPRQHTSCCAEVQKDGRGWRCCVAADTKQTLPNFLSNLGPRLFVLISFPRVFAAIYCPLQALCESSSVPSQSRSSVTKICYF